MFLDIFLIFDDNFLPTRLIVDKITNEYNLAKTDNYMTNILNYNKNSAFRFLNFDEKSNENTVNNKATHEKMKFSALICCGTDTLYNSLC